MAKRLIREFIEREYEVDDDDEEYVTLRNASESGEEGDEDDFDDDSDDEPEDQQPARRKAR